MRHSFAVISILVFQFFHFKMDGQTAISFNDLLMIRGTNSATTIGNFLKDHGFHYTGVEDRTVADGGWPEVYTWYANDDQSRIEYRHRTYLDPKTNKYQDFSVLVFYTISSNDYSQIKNQMKSRGFISGSKTTEGEEGFNDYTFMGSTPEDMTTIILAGASENYHGNKAYQFIFL